jgi:hypothetical protein
MNHTQTTMITRKTHSQRTVHDHTANGIAPCRLRHWERHGAMPFALGCPASPGFSDGETTAENGIPPCRSHGRNLHGGIPFARTESARGRGKLQCPCLGLCLCFCVSVLRALRLIHDQYGGCVCVYGVCMCSRVCIVPRAWCPCLCLPGAWCPCLCLPCGSCMPCASCLVLSASACACPVARPRACARLVPGARAGACIVPRDDDGDDGTL